MVGRGYHDDTTVSDSGVRLKPGDFLTSSRRMVAVQAVGGRLFVSRSWLRTIRVFHCDVFDFHYHSLKQAKAWNHAVLMGEVVPGLMNW